MHPNRTLLNWLLGLACGLPTVAAAQQTAPATQLDSAAWAVAEGSYVAQVGNEAVLYDGPEYLDYTTPGTLGSQFFLGPEARLGSVTYRGECFSNVRLRYDLRRDQLVLLYPGQAAAVALVPDKATAFAIDGHAFVRVAADSLLPTGYYEVLAEGPVRLLARYRKLVQRVTVGQNLAQQYQQTDELLLRTPTTLAAVSSLNRLLDALPPDRRAAVQHYVRQQRLSFSAAERIASARQVVRFYNLDQR